MAYGQTGSGKTFTMGSEAHTELELCDSTGLIPRCMKDLFLQLQHRKEQAASGGCGGMQQQQQQILAQQKAGANNNNTIGNETCSVAAVVLDYHIEASFLEVYGEDVHDLLLPSRPSVPIREDAGGGVVCSGLTHKKVATAEEALQVLHEGTLHRTTAATLMNLTSSRSHAVFTVTLTQTSGFPGDDYQLTSKSRFTFVDLAGSERMKKTGAEGERAREGIKINEGLLALGNVINALADEGRLAEGKKVHVPYRQSKLTRLLQDALGGNSRTLFLACVSPSDTNASETLSTLHYANRARNIKNAPVQNVDDTRALELQRLHSLNHVLQVELLKAKFGSQNDNDNEGSGKRSAIGDANVDFLQRDDVKVYLQQLQAVAQKKQQSAPAVASSSSKSFTPAMMALMSPRRPPTTNSCVAHGAPTMMVANNDNSDTPPQNRSVLESFDPTLLAEVNPDEDMAILDQLLELQQRDQDFDDTHKQDTVKLQEVDGELAKQEAMLLQLRESLRVYHDIKTKYELLVTEVQQLEAEKMQLAKELEAATVDPAQGCSAAIRKKLEMVEKTLERARCETRKQQQLCRKAEQDSHRCQALERKIHELKNGRAVMIKKQKEAATRHREYTECKTREIMTLKRKGRIAEKTVSKLQHEVQLHKKNLEKRQIYITKMNEKQKQTETHLMKLLAMRQRDLRRRTSMMAVPAGGGGGGRRSIMALHSIPESSANGGSGSGGAALLAGDFAPPTSQDVQTLSFLLNTAMDEEIRAIELQEQYENRMVEYGEAMRQMVVAVKAMGDVKKNGDEAEIADLEHTVEELELKVELIGSDLENLRTQLPDDDDDDENREPGQGHDEGTEEESTVARLIKDKPAPIVRTLLMDVVRKYCESNVRDFYTTVMERFFFFAYCIHYL
jgi:Kinesin motor domain